MCGEELGPELSSLPGGSLHKHQASYLLALRSSFAQVLLPQDEQPAHTISKHRYGSEGKHLSTLLEECEGYELSVGADG